MGELFPPNIMAIGSGNALLLILGANSCTLLSTRRERNDLGR